MGVAGSGKSTVLAALAERLRWPALEGDTLHPPSNVAKMAAGVPLNDADRGPWLAAIGGWIDERVRARERCLVTCSALRRSYRDALRRGRPSVWFVHLDAPAEVLRIRLATREGHFMPVSMLDSQLATLEPLAADEPGTAIPALATPDDLADEIVQRLRLDGG